MSERLKIGVVLAGGLSKGAYEIGVLQAIEEYFGREQIECISASSIGTLIGYSFLTGKTDEIISFCKGMDMQQSGRFFPKLSKDPIVLERIRSMIREEDQLDSKFYITLCNFTDRKAEYLLLNRLPTKQAREYMIASIHIPLINKGFRLNEKIYFDGSALDNIPVYPLLEQKLDYIFCIYFDQQTYEFENAPFDKKIIKLNDFPLRKRLIDDYVFDPEKIDSMITYGYDYGKRIIQQIFTTSSKEERLKRISEICSGKKSGWRCTSDVLLSNLNWMTSKLTQKQIL